MRGAQRPGLGPPHVPSPVGADPPQRGAGGLPIPVGYPQKTAGPSSLAVFRQGRGLTGPEIQRLWWRLLLPVVTDIEQAVWSYWRRYHQWGLHYRYQRQQASNL